MPWFIGQRKNDDDYVIGLAEAHMRRAGKTDEEIQRMRKLAQEAGKGKALEAIEDYIDLG